MKSDLKGKHEQNVDRIDCQAFKRDIFLENLRSDPSFGLSEERHRVICQNSLRMSSNDQPLFLGLLEL